MGTLSLALRSIADAAATNADDAPTPAQTKLVSIYRGMERQQWNCAPGCERR
jgi:hypothetical protein